MLVASQPWHQGLPVGVPLAILCHYPEWLTLGQDHVASIYFDVEVVEGVGLGDGMGES